MVGGLSILSDVERTLDRVDYLDPKCLALQPHSADYKNLARLPFAVYDHGLAVSGE